jgi:hypothetical protein
MGVGAGGEVGERETEESLRDRGERETEERERQRRERDRGERETEESLRERDRGESLPLSPSPSRERMCVYVCACV